MNSTHAEWLKAYSELMNGETTMKFPAKSSGDFEPVPAGNHVAICNGVIDLGVQPGRGMYPDPKHEVYIRFELPEETISYVKDGEEISGPMSIGRRFTASMSEKANLRKFIEAWFGKRFPNDDAASDFDLALLLGKMCLLNVTHTEKSGKVYANITNATPLPKAMKAEYKQHNPPLYFDLNEWDDAAFNALPEWLQKAINERIENEAPTSRHNGQPTPPVDAYDDSDVPF